MRVRSLGYRTDLIFPAFLGRIIDRGSYLVVQTPENPAYYWGNFLLFSDPPRLGDFDRWTDLFAREVGGPPAIQHQAFGWDSPEGDQGTVGPFLEAGFRMDRSTVLTCGAPNPPLKRSGSIEIRPLESDAEWEQALDLQVLSREPEFEESAYRDFRDREMVRYRRMVAAGLGAWYGAFDGGDLLGDLGIFTEHGLGRYQSVEVHPEARRQGIGGTLVYEAGLHAMDRHDLSTLVIVADEGSAAARLYSGLGFKPTEVQVGLERRPR